MLRQQGWGRKLGETRVQASRNVVGIMEREMQSWLAAQRAAGGRRPLSNTLVAPPPDCSKSIKEKAGTQHAKQMRQPVSAPPLLTGCAQVRLMGPTSLSPAMQGFDTSACQGQLKGLAMRRWQCDTGLVRQYYNSQSILARCAAHVARGDSYHCGGNSPGPKPKESNSRKYRTAKEILINTSL